MSETMEATVRNGVPVDQLFGTINVVKSQRELAAFQFRASNQWVNGTHSRTMIEDFTGAGGVQQHGTEFVLDADHPAVLCGEDNGPSPVEYLLHALATCLTAGIANVAAARGIELTSVESRIEGDMDLQGILGLSDEVRNGYQAMRISFVVEGDAPAEQLEAIVAQSQARSAVFDVITNQVPVSIDVATK
ncbi:MAG: OsmC family protein [Actinomycetota bacterium]